MRKIVAIAFACCAFALMLGLVACGGASSLAQETLDEADGIKVTAENAGPGNSATTGGAITVKEGDVIVISPFTDKGSFHLTITSTDGKVVAYDDDAEGKVMYSIEAEPGTYDVTTKGNGGTTGWMTVFSQNAQELAEQDASLNAELEKAGVDTGASASASASSANGAGSASASASSASGAGSASASASSSASSQ